jgi:hypothetical protein
MGCIAGCGVACWDCADAEAWEHPATRNVPTKSLAATESDPKVRVCVEGVRMPRPLALGMLALLVRKSSSKWCVDKQLVMSG